MTKIDLGQMLRDSGARCIVLPKGDFYAKICEILAGSEKSPHFWDAREAYYPIPVNRATSWQKFNHYDPIPDDILAYLAQTRTTNYFKGTGGLTGKSRQGLACTGLGDLFATLSSLRDFVPDSYFLEEKGGFNSDRLKVYRKGISGKCAIKVVYYTKDTSCLLVCLRMQELPQFDVAVWGSPLLAPRDCTRHYLTDEPLRLCATGSRDC